MTQPHILAIASTVFLSLLSSQAFAQTWVGTTKTYVQPDNPVGPTAIYLNTSNLDPTRTTPSNPFQLYGYQPDVNAIPSVWHEVDVTTLTGNISPSTTDQFATWVFLAGRLIITHTEPNHTADLYVRFRAHDAPSFTDSSGNPINPPCETTSHLPTTDPNYYAEPVGYIGQTVEQHYAGGQRSNMSTYVPLKDGKFDFCFSIKESGNLLTTVNDIANNTLNTYGINLSLQAFGTN